MIGMTRDEAIEVLENGFWWEMLIPVTTIEGRDAEDKLHEALDLALAALRFPTREMVERMRGECGKCSMPENMALDAGGAHEFRISGDAIYYCDSEYGWEGEKISYCPWCGKPLTDEAVQMVMERLEALYENT